MSAPTTTAQWTVDGTSGFDALNYHESAKIPTLAANDVLVKIAYASLNYRDLVITKVGSDSHVSPAQDER